MADVCIPSSAGGVAVGELVMPLTWNEVKTYTLRGSGIIIFGYGGYSPVIMRGDTKTGIGLSTSSYGNITATYDGTTLTLENGQPDTLEKTFRYILIQ